MKELINTKNNKKISKVRWNKPFRSTVNNYVNKYNKKKVRYGHLKNTPAKHHLKNLLNKRSDLIKRLWKYEKNKSWGWYNRTNNQLSFIYKEIKKYYRQASIYSNLLKHKISGVNIKDVQAIDTLLLLKEFVPDATIERVLMGYSSGSEKLDNRINYLIKESGLNEQELLKIFKHIDLLEINQYIYEYEILK